MKLLGQLTSEVAGGSATDSQLLHAINTGAVSDVS